jgi:hypothetical protein
MAKNFFKDLCPPALLYLVISGITLLMVAFQNLGNSNLLTIGNYNSKVQNTALILTIKALCILFWTWVLNIICKSGYKWVSWLLVLLPFILIFFMMSVVSNSY